MFSKLYNKIKNWERKWKSSFGDDISTPEARKKAMRHNNLVDHAFLRRIWTNRYQLCDDVWRSNQPDPVHFRALSKLGIKSVINLRGASKWSYYLFEKEACEEHNMALYDHTLVARDLASPAQYLELLDLMARVEKPMLIHCKSGADRTGLAAALYLLDQEGRSLTEARAQLSIKYAHQRWSKTGILDHLLDTYEAYHAKDPIPVRDWLEHYYDPQATTAAFIAARSRK
jgi:protein tyrosine/serine phosphatase